MNKTAMALLVCVCAAAWLPGLDHPFITHWDEAIHQNVVRQLVDAPFSPRVYPRQIFPPPSKDAWTETPVFLHKPTLPFWLGALVMHFTGVTPLALRLVSAAAGVLAVLATFVLARSVAGFLASLLVALAFALLPFHWRLVQGYQFGDVTDVTLCAAQVLAFVFLARALRDGRWRLFALAGAVTGVGFLCKSALALAPLGVVCMQWLLRRRVPNRASLGGIICMVLAFVAVALPWNAYCWWRWPAEFAQESLHTLQHLNGAAGARWMAPFDAIFNTINADEFAPMAVVLPLLAFVILCRVALSKRRLEVVMIALWVGAEWLVLSVAKEKVPATAWGCVPGVFCAFAVALEEAWSSAPVAAALLAGALAPGVQELLPFISRVRDAVPAFFPQTHANAGLAEGMVLVALATAGAALWPRKIIWAAAATVAVALLFIPENESARAATARWYGDTLAQRTYVHDLVVLDATLPKNSVLFANLTEPSDWFSEGLSALFWTKRPAYRRPPDLTTAQRKGVHPYLLSSRAEPFRSLAEVPAASWLRAYDLLAPAAAPELPAGVTPLNIAHDGVSFLGFASEPADATRDRYVFFLHGKPVPLAVHFVAAGFAETAVLQPSLALQSQSALSDAAWYMVPAIALPRTKLVALQIGGEWIDIHQTAPPK